MRGVADALGGLEAVEVGLLPLDVDGVEGVEAEPRREGEPVLVGQLRDRRQDDGLKARIRISDQLLHKCYPCCMIDDNISGSGNLQRWPKDLVIGCLNTASPGVHAS